MFLKKALRSGRLYDNVRLKQNYLKGLYSSICYSIRTSWGAHKEAITQTLPRCVAFIVKFQKGAQSPTSSTKEHNTSRLKLSKSSRSLTGIIHEMAIKKSENRLSSSSEGQIDIRGYLFARQNKYKRTTTTLSLVLQQ